MKVNTIDSGILKSKAFYNLKAAPAAEKIQSFFRGSSFRKKFYKNKENLYKQENLEDNFEKNSGDKKPKNNNNNEKNSNQNDNKANKEKYSFEVTILDTAGQEKFRAITNSFFKGADGILILYDVTNRQSFEQVKIWIESLEEALGNHKTGKYVTS